ncbi:MAG TPA: CocE/NonD family hydrolase, partial [Geminicoccaceae bacterium]|nr:CocE/NonD family hydrolase [Geminicoccaceae bacterium]
MLATAARAAGKREVEPGDQEPKPRDLGADESGCEATVKQRDGVHMKIVAEFPRKVREIENLTIQLADGCRLAARVWLPVDAEADPVPAILEYLPYRKRDGTSQRDALTHPYIAGH